MKSQGLKYHGFLNKVLVNPFEVNFVKDFASPKLERDLGTREQ